MTSKIVNEDLRSIKTRKALYDAIFSLLKSLSFKKITIKEICEEAFISRATFYAHYVDKYDLLKHWLPELWPKEFDRTAPYERLERIINQHISENMVILRNLVQDADDETFDILFEFMLSIIDLSVEKGKVENYPKNIVLSNFYAGGLLSYLMWQINNKFPSDVPTMNRYLYEIILELQDWRSNK